MSWHTEATRRIPSRTSSTGSEQQGGSSSWWLSCGSSRTYFNPTGLRSRACFLNPQRTQLTRAPQFRLALEFRITAAGPPTKMSAGALEQLIRSAPSSKRPPQDVRCLPTQGGWDYVCLYQTDGPQPRTLKIGVRVSVYADRRRPRHPSRWTLRSCLRSPWRGRRIRRAESTLNNQQP